MIYLGDNYPTVIYLGSLTHLQEYYVEKLHGTHFLTWYLLEKRHGPEAGMLYHMLLFRGVMVISYTVTQVWDIDGCMEILGGVDH